jgi:GntR family transcriptional regulator, galactonate operon transcriptional repressor
LNLSSYSAREQVEKRMRVPSARQTHHSTPPKLAIATQRDSLFQQVADRIGVGIASGTIAIGEILPNETDLGRDLRVSRTSYREAVKFLSAKGLVEARQKSGTRVAPRSKWNVLDPDVLRWSLHNLNSETFVRDLFELRRFIEPNAAKLAAERRTDVQLEVIAMALDGLETREPYSEAHIESDLAFHTAILDAAGNSAVLCLRSVIETTLHWSMRLQNGKERGAFTMSMADHRRVYEAIANRDGDMAHTVMTTLVLVALADTREALARGLKAKSNAVASPQKAAE